jgi:C-5 cytosine-specific DNA methylase
MRKPLLLDLFCKAGGAAVGYYRAGFDVVGVDVESQPRYPFPFVQADAMLPPFDLRDFDVIHASPPCQAFSHAKNIGGKKDHPQLIESTRAMLAASGKIWVIENVPGSPLVFPALICGLALGLGVKRHRLFESNVFLFGTECPSGHRGKWITVFGGGAPKVPDTRRRAGADASRKAMRIDWMTRSELSQAIPPAYTEWIGRQLIAALKETIQ